MNSINDYNCKDKSKICCSHTEPGKAILKCATGGAGPLPLITLGSLTAPIPIVSVTVDTAKLCNPTVRLIFTSQINIPVAVAVTLNFTIIKSCDGGAPQQIGGTYTYSLAVGVIESVSFDFQLCDFGCCERCCTYTVQLAPTTLTAGIGVTITNATITALAVDGLSE